MTSGSGSAERLDERGGLQDPERRLAVGLEDLAHGAAGAGLDELVGVDQPPAETGGDLASDRRLAGAHHPDEDDVAIAAAAAVTGSVARNASALRTQLVDRVAAELALRLGGQHEGDHRLGDDAHRRHRGDVGALLERHRRLLRRRVDRLQHRHVERRQRLHRGPHDDQLARRHAALDPAGERRVPAVLAVGGVPADGVVGLAPPPAGDVEPVADLDALDGLDAHHGLGEQGVELAVPVDVAAEPDGHALGEHLDDAAERVAVLGRGLDLEDHRIGAAGIEAAHRRLVDRGQVGERRAGAGRHRLAHLHDVGEHVDAELGEQQLGERAGGDAGRRLPGAGPLEHVTGVGEAVLLHAREVGVAGADLGQRGLRGAGRGVHLLVPLVAAEPLGVLDLDGHRRAERAAVADAADEGQLVDLEALARAAAVAEAPAGQLGLDVLDRHGEPGGQALDDDHEPLPVRFAGGEVAEHGAPRYWPHLPTPKVDPSECLLHRSAS